VAGVDCGADQEAGIAAEVSRRALWLLALMHYAFVLGLIQHAFVLARIRLTRMAAGRGPILSGACGQIMTFHNPWLSTCLPCASPRSEHGILGKRRVKLRSPAVGRPPRGCQPDEQFRPRLSGTLWSAAVRVRGSRAQRRGRLDDSTHFTAGIKPTYWPAFALRGRPLSAALSSPALAARLWFVG
jgi:hypothetical protein